ncbi:MAG: DUF1513 domain-containing protein, partial [Pseudomonadota bacterium]
KNIINKDNFESSIAYIDINTGKLLEKYHVSHYPKVSLRHLIVGVNGEVFIGAQSFGDKTYPLIYRHHKGANSIEAFNADEHIWQSHQHYTADMALYQTILGVTSPRGNVVSYWDLNRCAWLSQQQMTDVAGIANPGDSFYLTSGTGCISDIKKGSSALNYCYSLAWDNHLLASG